MKKVKFYLSIGFQDASYEEIIEFEDDITREEIEEEFQDWKNGYIDMGWHDMEETI